MSKEMVKEDEEIVSTEEVEKREPSLAIRAETQLSNQELREKMAIIERQYHGDDAILGCNLLTNANKVNSPRTMMLFNQIPQAEHYVEAEVPRWFTNYENLFGRYSSSITASKGNYEVVDKISKFSKEGLEDVSYILLVKDLDTGEFDIIGKKEYEKLTETHGYKYVTDKMDSLDVGDIIPQGEVLSKSSNFDKYDNYMYGVNALVAYVVDENVIEDSIKCSESFAKRASSRKVDETMISINDNDILLNIFGDENEYKTFPDLGESTWKQIVAVKRRMDKSTMMHDLKYDQLSTIDFDNDTLSICEGTVVDIDVYCNKPLEELPEDKVYYGQIREYYEESLRYNQEIVDSLELAINSGRYSVKLSRIYQRAKNVINHDVKWESEGNSFSNLMIKFTIVNSVPLVEGSKLTGRYGNKGVISKIIPDEEMPRLEDGRILDLEFSMLGITNRLNPAQLDEQMASFMADRYVKKRVLKLDKLKDRIDALYEFMAMLNEGEAKSYKEYLKSLPKDVAMNKIEMLAVEGILLHAPPMWDTISFQRLLDVYAKWKDIFQADKATVVRNGKRVPLMKPIIAGYQYILKLKHHPLSKFIARDTGFINPRGLPAKSLAGKKKEIMSSRNPVKVGEQEKQAMFVGKNIDIVVKYDMLHRSSVIGRRYLGDILYDCDTIFPKKIELPEDATNRNAEMLKALLKSIGLYIEDVRDRAFKDEVAGLVIELEKSDKAKGLVIELTRDSDSDMDDLTNVGLLIRLNRRKYPNDSTIPTKVVEE